MSAGITWGYRGDKRLHGHTHAGDPITAVVDCFQRDAPVSHGNSGGPIINEAGKRVGVEYSK